MAVLYSVATPIGNLEDITLRAKRVLKECPVVAAESVRRTRGLLSHLGLGGKRVISCREANRNQAVRQVLECLGREEDVALCSDAGTPGVSDPGAAVVRAVLEAGYKVSPIPGPSALASALSVAGIKGGRSVFLGFMPVKSGARRKMIESAAATGFALVIFEAPHRLVATVGDLMYCLGDREVIFTREISKLNEEVALLKLSDLAALEDRGDVKGEITLVVAGGELDTRQEVDADGLDDMIAQALAKGDLPPAKLAKKIARETGLARDEIYRKISLIKQEK